MNVLQMPRGNSGYIPFTIEDWDESPLDLSDRRVRFMIKEHLTDPDSMAIVSLTSDDPTEIALTDPTQGEGVVIMEPEYTRDLMPHPYHYDLVVEWTEGGRERRKTVILPTYIEILPVVDRGEAV